MNVYKCNQYDNTSKGENKHPFMRNLELNTKNAKAFASQLFKATNHPYNKSNYEVKSAKWSKLITARASCFFSVGIIFVMGMVSVTGFK